MGCSHSPSFVCADRYGAICPDADRGHDEMLEAACKVLIIAARMAITEMIGPHSSPEKTVDRSSLYWVLICAPTPSPPDCQPEWCPPSVKLTACRLIPTEESSVREYSRAHSLCTNNKLMFVSFVVSTRLEIGSIPFYSVNFNLNTENQIALLYSLYYNSNRKNKINPLD